MYGVVMAGGKSTRFGDEKQIQYFGKKRLIDIACEAVIDAGLKCIVAVSKNALKTYDYVRRNYDFIDTTGIDYCNDVKFLLENLEKKFLTIASDIPFVTYRDVEEIIKNFKNNSLAGAVFIKNKIIHVGINIVYDNTEDIIFLFSNKLLILNVNTRSDLERALKIKELLENFSCFHVP